MDSFIGKKAKIGPAPVRIDAKPALSLDECVQGLASGLSDLAFKPVLTRGGWYRPGGLLNQDGERVSDSLVDWLEHQVADDIDGFLDRYQNAGLVATRLQGRTHYLTAVIGDAPDDFVQLEVEELREVADRVLLPDGWVPDDVQDLLDPLERSPLPPEPVGRAQFEVRRYRVIPELFTAGGSKLAPLRRFIYDWAASSAGKHRSFSRHWVLALRDVEGSDGEMRVSAKPIPAMPAPSPGLAPYDGRRGVALLDDIRRFDQQVGYPFAWFFAMLTGPCVPFDLAEAVLADLADDFDYLPPRDALILAGWANKRYAV